MPITDPTTIQLRRLSGSSLDAARWLLGARLTSTLGGEVVSVRLTEVEAYGGVGLDPASHAHRRRTVRNAPMFGPPGALYVYRSYGIHHLINIVTEPEGVAGAVLLRAGEVVQGHAAVQARRGPGARRPIERWASGPGNLAQALGVVDTELSGQFVGFQAPGTASQIPLTLQLPARRARHVLTGPRVGIGEEGMHLPWRLWIDGDPTVSAHRGPTRRRPASGGSGARAVRQDGAP